MQKDFRHLIGIPYKEKDCWGVVTQFYKDVFSIELKSYYTDIPETKDIAKNIIYSSKGDFQLVENRKFGDIFLIKLLGVECHIAVYIGDGMVLHTTEHSGCVIERVSRWEKRIVGTYRVLANDTT